MLLCLSLLLLLLRASPHTHPMPRAPPIFAQLSPDLWSRSIRSSLAAYDEGLARRLAPLHALQRRYPGTALARVSRSRHAAIAARWEANARAVSQLLTSVRAPVTAIWDRPWPGSAAGDGSEGRDGGGYRRHPPTEGQAHDGPLSYDSVVSVVEHLARDWATAGSSARTRLYAPVLEALYAFEQSRLVVGKQTVSSIRTASTSSTTTSSSTTAAATTMRVLVPGCGLARLALEIALLSPSIRVEANDMSPALVAAAAAMLEAVATPRRRAGGSGEGGEAAGFREETQMKEEGETEVEVEVGVEQDVRDDRYEREEWEEREEREGLEGGGIIYPGIHRTSDVIDGGANMGGLLVPGENIGEAMATTFGEGGNNAGSRHAARLRVGWPLNVSVDMSLEDAVRRITFRQGAFEHLYGGDRFDDGEGEKGSEGGQGAGGGERGERGERGKGENVGSGSDDGSGDGGKGFDAIVTSFFIDTCRDVGVCLEVIYRNLRPGGLWINVGPLSWHTPPPTPPAPFTPDSASSTETKEGRRKTGHADGQGFGERDAAGRGGGHGDGDGTDPLYGLHGLALDELGLLAEAIGFTVVNERVLESTEYTPESGSDGRGSASSSSSSSGPGRDSDNDSENDSDSDSDRGSSSSSSSSSSNGSSGRGNTLRPLVYRAAFIVARRGERLERTAPYNR